MPKRDVLDEASGDALKALRAKLGFTQDEMAKRYGVFLRTYQRWESGAGVRDYHVQLARTWLAKPKRRA